MDENTKTEEENNEVREKLLQELSKTIVTVQEKVSSRKLSIDNVDDLIKVMPLTRDTECGLGCFRGPILQKFANKKAYVITYGILICMLTASAAYFNGTITTIEKRFKIPSKTTGVISIGNYIAQLLSSGAVTYYANKGHKPRWIAIGIYTMVLYCCLSVVSHFVYGPGNDALQLTKEYNEDYFTPHQTKNPIAEYRERKFLCLSKENSTNQCEKLDSNFAPQIFLFSGRFFYGIGDSIVFSLGISYLDDNIQKSKTPAFISLSYFIKMLGPAIGYWLASFALKSYIVPSLTPTITVQDPRWLGAWWMGWIIFAVTFSLIASVMALFPKTLPRAAARHSLTLKKINQNNTENPKKLEQESSASWIDMIHTFKRLCTNKILICNKIAAVFFIFGYTPYWVFLPKYIETQFKQSASDSSLITGLITLSFSAFGFLVSGLIISKFKPKARYLAAYNVFSSVIAIIGITTYAFIGCTANENQLINIQNNQNSLNITSNCNHNCNCDFVTYNPVCSDTGKTFISACHAGCRNIIITSNGTKVYTDCSCVENKLKINSTRSNLADQKVNFGSAVPGSCPVDCKDKLFLFLAIVCIIKVTSSAGTMPSFLVTLRCVDAKDKAVAMGFGLSILSLFAFIPAPIVFGYIFDTTCLVWGKTCTGTSNCWMYDSETLRYLLNLTSAAFIGIGTFFHVGVWYFVKDVQIFDEEMTAEKYPLSDERDS